MVAENDLHSYHRLRCEVLLTYRQYYFTDDSSAASKVAVEAFEKGPTVVEHGQA